ncbi:MAG TPA: C4-type zinc ribbon domain-containing protein [Planctomycetota bacterium]|nr:C4-type zinc ribbon domain-containing protein [Planctomycetota bacterium]
MNPIVVRLREVQELDRELRGLRAQRDALPREAARREAEVARLRQEVEHAREEHRRSLARVKDLENDAQERRDRIAKLEIQSNMVRHTAELLALQHQVATLREEISRLEDEAIGLLDRIEELGGHERRARERLGEEEKVFASFREAAKADLAACEARLREQEGRRGEAVQGLDAGLLSLYERMLGARDGEVIARVDGERCQGCFVEIPPNDFVRLVRAKEVVFCRHCQRILFLGEEPEAAPPPA